MANKTSGYNPADPELKLTDEETESYAGIVTKLTQELQTFSSKYVTDDSFGDKEWEAFGQSAESMDLSTALKILNDAQARFNGSK